jgi:hypothetical protein
MLPWIERIKFAGRTAMLLFRIVAAKRLKISMASGEAFQRTAVNTSSV